VSEKHFIHIIESCLLLLLLYIFFPIKNNELHKKLNNLTYITYKAVQCKLHQVLTLGKTIIDDITLTQRIQNLRSTECLTEQTYCTQFITESFKTMKVLIYEEGFCSQLFWLMFLMVMYYRITTSR